nr:hypothetical protein [Tanacetum cinerariifolium]
MLNDPTNQISGSSSNPNNNPGSSTQPPFNQMSHYLNFQPQYSSQAEQMLFAQFKMQMQMNQFSQQQQQQSNQATGFEPQSDHQSFNLLDETKDENEEDPIPITNSKKTSRGPRLKAKAKKQRHESQGKVKKCARNLSTDEEELLWRNVSFKFPRIQQRVVINKKIPFGKILDVYNTEAKKSKFVERTKNTLTGKWTPMNAVVQKFNQLVTKTLVHSGKND